METIIAPAVLEQDRHDGIFARISNLGYKALEKICSIVPIVPESREDALAMAEVMEADPTAPLTPGAEAALRTVARLQGEHGFIRLP